MENQDNGVRCVPTYGGFNGDSEHSLALNLELLAPLELPLKQNFPKKTSLQLIAWQLAGKVPTLQQKTEAGIRTLEFPINARARNQGVFFLCHPINGGSGGAPFRWPEFDGSGCSNSVWATTTEIRTSCGSNLNPSETASMMRLAYCCNLNPLFIVPEPHNPRVLYSQNSFRKSSLRLIASRLAAKVSMLQQKTEAGIRTLESTQAPEHATVACFFVPSYQWWLRQGTFTVAGSFGSGCSNPVWATTTEIRTSCGSNFHPKRLPA